MSMCSWYESRHTQNGKATSVPNSTEERIRRLFGFFSPLNDCFFSHWAHRWDGQPWPLSDSVSRSSRKEHEDYRKGKILLGAAFYFQFVFICPPAPLGCLWERVSTCFIGRYCVSRSKSVFTHRCEWRTSVSVPLLFFCSRLELSGCEWVRLSLCVWIERVCVC